MKNFITYMTHIAYEYLLIADVNTLGFLFVFRIFVQAFSTKSCYVSPSSLVISTS